MIQKKANDVKPTTNVDDMDFEEDDAQRYHPQPQILRAATNSNYLMDAIPGGSRAQEIGGDLDVNMGVVEPGFYENPNFGDMNDGEDLLGMGNIGDQRGAPG